MLSLRSQNRANSKEARCSHLAEKSVIRMEGFLAVASSCDARVLLAMRKRLSHDHYSSLCHNGSCVTTCVSHSNFHAAGIRSRGQPRTAADELWHRHSTSFRFKLLPSAPIKAIPCQLRSLRAWLFAPINRRYIPRSYARSALKFTILHRTCVQRL